MGSKAVEPDLVGEAPAQLPPPPGPADDVEPADALPVEPQDPRQLPEG